MKPIIDDSEVRILNRQLSIAGKAFTKPLLGQSLRLALKPVETIAKSEAPVGQTRFKSTRLRRTSSGKIKRDTTYDKGGATRRGIRTLIVNGSGEVIVKGLVGVSKRRGFAGWRTHLITRTNLHRRVANDFLGRTEQRGTPLVIASLSQSAQEVVRKVLSKYV